MANRIKWTLPLRAEFLEKLRKTPNVSHACRAVGISSSTVYEQRKTDPEFKEAWEDALAAALDDIEAVGFERARDGSDGMIKWLLARHRPEQYGDRLAVDNQHMFNPGSLEATTELVRRAVHGDT